MEDSSSGLSSTVATIPNPGPAWAMGDRLRERAKLRYIGDCKCGTCQLVPVEMVHEAADLLQDMDGQCGSLGLWCQQLREDRACLYAALVRLLHSTEPDPHSPWAAGSDVEQARAAIAKTTVRVMDAVPVSVQTGPG